MNLDATAWQEGRREDGHEHDDDDDDDDDDEILIECAR